MTATEINLKGCYIIHPDVYKDKRGYFFETFNEKDFKAHTGLDISFVQDNESKSSFGVLRGLHFQKGEYGQAKLIRVVSGKILDVIVDVRPNSKTFGEHFSIELSDINKTQLYIPVGFAHGFVTLSDEAVVTYKCDNFYNKESEIGIIYNDPTLNINWILKPEELIISDKDLNLPKLENI